MNAPHETPILAQPADVTPPAAFADHGNAPKKDDHGGGNHRVELPPMRGGVVALMGLAFVALLAALFVVGWLPNHRRNAEIEARAGERKSDKPIVSVVMPKHSQQQSAIELPGTARAFQSTAIYPRASGYVRKLGVDIGDKVKAGDVLAEIETPELDAQLASANATLEQNRAAATRADSDLALGETTLKRYQSFAETGGVTQQQLDEKRSAYEQAKSAQAGAAATVKSGEAEVQRLTALQGFQRVTAPFAGTITMRNYDVGALLAATNGSRPIFQLDQIDVIRVFVDVPQAYAPQITIGNATRLVTRADPNRPFAGKIARTAGAIDETTRTLRVEADFPNPDGRLLPGTYGQFAVRRRRRGPQAAADRADGRARLRLEGHAARQSSMRRTRRSFKPVVVGRDYGTDIEIVSGLDGSERVVANPGERVADGVEVEIANPDGQSGGGEKKPAMADATGSPNREAAAR